MPRPPRPPPLPLTPGDWLACFRFRLTTPNGRRYSPEQFAFHLGISGDTLRRWESGQSQPSRTDLQNFAYACDLKPMEAAFLLEAFNLTHTEEPPEPERFQQQAEELLSSEFPAFLFDSLFYVRAWNSYIDVTGLPWRNPPMGDHILESVLSPPDPKDRGLEGREERQGRWLRTFWFSTANLCGTQPYIQLVQHLSNNEEFRKRWLRLAMGEDPDVGKPISGPYYARRRETGHFRVSSSRVALPPFYYLQEYVPVDRVAERRLEMAHARGPVRVIVRDRIHWAQGTSHDHPHALKRAV